MRACLQLQALKHAGLSERGVVTCNIHYIFCDSFDFVLYKKTHTSRSKESHIQVPLLPLGNCLYRLIIYQSPFVAIGQLPVSTVLIIYQKTSLKVNKTLYSFVIVSLSVLLACDS